MDDESDLAPPHRRSWEHPERDIRIDWSILTLIDEESPSCRNLHGGERLIPFANLYWRDQHPDGMGIDEGVINLVAFDYGSGERPRVVVVLADKAQEEFTRWDRALVKAKWKVEEPVRYGDFTVPVTESFDVFLTRLRKEP